MMIHLPARRLCRTVVLAFAVLTLPACNGGRVTHTSGPGLDEPTTPPDAVQTPFRVGAAKVRITPTESQVAGEEENRLLGQTTLQHFHLGGYGFGPLQSFPDPINMDLTDPAGATHYTTAEGVEEHTWLRLMLITDERDNTQVAFVTVDAIGAGNVIQDGIRQAVSQASGVPPENVYFGQTHTHSGADLQGLWGGVPKSWIADLYAAAEQAAEQAAAELTPATLSFKQFETDAFNNYRRPRLYPDIDADTTASLLRAYAADGGELVATLAQYNAHPTSVGSSNDPRLPHPDYVLGLTDTLEAEGGTALYFNGPIADASGSGGNCEGDDYVRVRCRGHDLARAMLDSEAETIAITGALSARNTQVQIPVTNPVFLAAALIGAFNGYLDYSLVPLDSIPFLSEQIAFLPQAIPLATVAVSRISFSEQLEIVTIPGEATNTVGEYIQSLAPDTPMMLFGLTQDSMGYLLPEEEFNYISLAGETGFLVPFTNYEEWISMGPLSVPLLRVLGYNRLFDQDAQANIPPSVAACYGADTHERCFIEDVVAQLNYAMAAYADACREQLGEDNPICGLLAMGSLFQTGGALDLSALSSALPIDLSEALATPDGQTLQQRLAALLAPLRATSAH